MPQARTTTVKRCADKANAAVAPEPADVTDAAAKALIGPVDLNEPELYFNREVNWIDFNAKVLAEAQDAKVPLLERVKFLSIYWNNLDEFFMVRVANVMRQANTGAEGTGADKMPPKKQLAVIRRKVVALNEAAEELWRKSLRPTLKKRGIEFTRYRALEEAERVELDQWFERNVYPVLTPQVIDAGHPFPWISNTSLNFLIELVNAEREDDVRIVRLKCPNNLPRFLFLPECRDEAPRSDLSFDPAYRNVRVLLIEDLIAEHLDALFPGYVVKAHGLFRLTRNTDVEIEEDEADDLLEAVRDFVDQRRFGNAVRLELDAGLTGSLRRTLLEHLDVQAAQIYRSSAPLGMSEFMSLALIDRPALQYAPDRTLLPAVFEKEGDLFGVLKRQDMLLFHPYHKFASVLEFLDRAARDPKVVAIKQTLYRCGNNSPIIRSLVEARRRGKQVTAVVELKARFDEERNINWAESLEKAGVNVVYGFVGLKVHAKLCLVVRREADGIRRYVHIGTGNYNPLSAKIYTDLGLLTSDERVCADVTDLFNVMTGCGVIKRYRELAVSPVSMRPRLEEMIEREIEAHRSTGDGHIIIKCNQLADEGMIKALYRASQAGVKVECIVRGVCCLRPGVPGVSESISVRSIVGRYLEHARVYWFKHGGEAAMWIGSADLMRRNLRGRIEVLVPIKEARLREHVFKHVLAAELADTKGAWTLDSEGAYRKVQPEAGKSAFDSQSANYQCRYL